MNNCHSTPRPHAAGMGSNLLLDSVSRSTRMSLDADLQQVDLLSGTRLYEAGTMPRHVYFPTTAVISLSSSMRDGGSAEFAVIGSEGVVGVCTCMGKASAHDTAIVQTEGKALRMPVASFVRETWHREDLMRPVLRYSQALMMHVSQTAACNRLHSVEQRLGRWFLTMFDRQQGREMRVTHERIAALLGVRREGVTGAAFKLQSEGVITYARGRVELKDRPKLEARSCECHGVIRKAYAQLAEAMDTQHSAEEHTRIVYRQAA